MKEALLIKALFAVTYTANCNAVAVQNPPQILVIP